MNTIKIKDTTGLFHIVFIDKIVELKELMTGVTVIITVSDRIVTNADLQDLFNDIITKG